METIKAPEEIKKGLECCASVNVPCEICMFRTGTGAECIRHMSECALAYIQQLEMRHGKDINVPRWISVEERLPEDVITSWLIYANGDIETACWTHDKYGLAWWFFVDGEYAIGVTHWMPLPEPPKEE